MKYERFEDLPVWKDPIELAVRMDEFMEDQAFRGKASSRDQWERDAISFSNNIAKGSDRGATQELTTSLYSARGSAGEARSMLQRLIRLPTYSDLKSRISNMRSLAESISRQLRGWADGLQKSDIKGQRYLNEKTRKDYDRQKEREGAMAEWRQMREELTASSEAEQKECPEQREREARKQSGA
jgi:four helix bundle protein